MSVTISGDTGVSLAANVSGTVAVANGGTGSTSLTANNVLLGNGTSAVQAVAPGTNGNVLTSNGTTWTSAALPAGGVTSLNGQTGAITNTDYGAIGSYVIACENDYTASQERLPNVTVSGSALHRSNEAAGTNNQAINTQGANTQVLVGISNTGATSLGLSGTWRRMTRSMNSSTTGRSAANLYVRIS